MLRSERRSLIRFLSFYLVSTFLLFAAGAWIFYRYWSYHILQNQKEALRLDAKRIETKLRELHHSDADILYYPVIPGISSAIYDLDERVIFSTFSRTPKPHRDDNATMLFYTLDMQPYYLGAAYLTVAKAIDMRKIEALRRRIVAFMIAAGIFFVVTGYVLGRLFIAPMREAIARTNRFVQDATHEMNTPVSTILTNIELIETFEKCPHASEELQRIAIASKTLQRIHEDLIYLHLDRNAFRTIESLDMRDLIKERIAYFQAAAQSKGVRIELDAKRVVKRMDRQDAVRIIDNLLSNAVKYNRHGGTVRIRVDEETLEVADTGRGIDARVLHMVGERYRRFDSSEGGFGIGLDIVKRICDDYGFVFEIASRKNEGTQVRIRWKA